MLPKRSIYGRIRRGVRRDIGGVGGVRMTKSIVTYPRPGLRLIQRYIKSLNSAPKCKCVDFFEDLIDHIRESGKKYTIADAERDIHIISTWGHPFH